MPRADLAPVPAGGPRGRERRRREEERRRQPGMRRERALDRRRGEERERGADRDEVPALAPRVGRADAQEGEEEEAREGRGEQEAQPPRGARCREERARELQEREHGSLREPQRLEEIAPAELRRPDPDGDERAVRIARREPARVSEQRRARREPEREREAHRERGPGAPPAQRDTERPERGERRPLGAGDREPPEPRGDDPRPVLGPAEDRDRQGGGERQLGHGRGRLAEEVVLREEERRGEPRTAYPERARSTGGRCEGDERRRDGREARRANPERRRARREEREPGPVPRVEQPRGVGQRRAQVEVVRPRVVHGRDRRGDRRGDEEERGDREQRPVRGGEPAREREGDRRRPERKEEQEDRDHGTLERVHGRAAGEPRASSEASHRPAFRRRLRRARMGAPPRRGGGGGGWRRPRGRAHATRATRAAAAGTSCR